MSAVLDRIITADDLIRGGACRDGVMRSASPEWPAAFPVSVAVKEASRRHETVTVLRALDLDGYGYGDGYGGDGYGSGDDDGDGYGYGDDDGDGE
ncbi:hypothetical protein [Azorhizobium caulinodans]|uniref:hypothetical protein n=1 Tax=Azorhizobium caulinodans TaxID=7 RepID=UPI002FBDBA35